MSDPDLETAIFLVKHSNFTAQDFGYPPGDFILRDLINLYDRRNAEATNRG